jgi:hypothetical protein
MFICSKVTVHKDHLIAASFWSVGWHILIGESCTMVCFSVYVVDER